MGERRGAYSVLVGKPEGKRYLEDPGKDGRMIRWIIRKWDRGAWIGLDLAEVREVAGSCKCCNEPLGFIKCEEFLG
jgi:hypothetical protein